MEDSQLKVALIQSHIHWHRRDENLNMFAEKINSIRGSVDLLVLPEMFNTGFSMEAADQAETIDGPTIEWMSEIAKRSNAVITGSVIIRESNQFFNRLIWMTPNGKPEFYDKRHLFRFAKEDLSYTAGQQRKIVTLKDWRICLNVCYDLRFPVWTRNRNDYDVLLFAANWPEVRRYPWRTLLRARAIENLCYVIGLNRIGYDGMGNYFSGDSAVIHPSGKAIVEETKKESILMASISKDELREWNKVFPFYKDQDDFTLSH